MKNDLERKETAMYFDKPGNDIISIGGSGGGADAALVLKPAHQNNFFDLRIREIICKPRAF